MAVTATELRANIYRLIDEVLRSGTPLEVERNGRTVRIVAVEPPSKLDRLQRRPDLVVGDAEALVHLDWSSEWKP
jgi:prevent-host-death family protein